MMRLRGYARAADSRGVDIIENCEVTDFIVKNNKVIGLETTKGKISTRKVGCAVAGSSGRLVGKVGIRLPIESHVLQVFVSEGLKPISPWSDHLWSWAFLHKSIGQRWTCFWWRY